MGRVCCALVLLAGTAAAQPRKLLDAPVLTIRPQAALSAFTGDGADVVVGWRPVGEAARYRVTLTNAEGASLDLETTDLRIEKKALAVGRYQLTVTAIDQSGVEGAISDALPITVLEVRAVPPGASQSTPPTRGAYAVGTRLSVAGMHCELGNAPIDDLLVGPENELRLTQAGVANVRCAGIPGFLEKQVVIAPVSIAAQATRVARGGSGTVHVTLASVAALGDKLEVQAIGDVFAGEIKRTSFGLDIAVTAGPEAQSGALVIKSGDFELGRVDLALYDAPPPPPPPYVAPNYYAFDLGGQLGVFVPPTDDGGATNLGGPSNPDDIITAGPLFGVRLGFFPARRVGIEAEAALAAGGYKNESGISQMLTSRAGLAVRAIESGRLGLRLVGGAGAWTTLRERNTSRRTTEGFVHAGVAVTVETTPNLWLRIQICDLVTAARDDGYAHVPEIQLGIVARFGRRDSFE